MKTDAELLREFVSGRAEDAFAELVNRHIGIVYSAACRETQGDLAAAQDVTQLVFIELVRKAAGLLNHPTLAGWLYVSVRYVSANLRRSDHRRKIHEQQAGDMNDLTRPISNDPTWQEIRPVIDDAMHELNTGDRDAVLLRFFEGKSLREVGDALCLTENAARMRVERALDKLRGILAKRGVRSTSSALAGALATGMIATPPAVVAAVTGTALATASVSAASATTLFGAVTLTKSAMVGISAAVVVAVSVPIWQQQRYQRLATENATLRNQLELVSQQLQENQRLIESPNGAGEHAQTKAIDPGASGTSRTSKTGEGIAISERNPENTWRQRFEAVYQLRGGKILHCISAPFIPERAEFCRREFRNQSKAPDYLVLRQDAKNLHARGVGVEEGITRLEGVLRYVVGLKRQEFFGTDELLATAVPGDWVVRPSASIASQLAALEVILRDTTGRNIRFERSPADIDVIVVRGNFAPAKADQKFEIYAENRDPSWKKSSRGNFHQFLQALGDSLNVPFASEVQMQNDQPISWYCHADADYSHAGDRRLELLNKVLANLNQQTSLTFALERRLGEVWLVKDQGKNL